MTTPNDANPSSMIINGAEEFSAQFATLEQENSPVMGGDNRKSISTEEIESATAPHDGPGSVDDNKKSIVNPEAFNSMELNDDYTDPHFQSVARSGGFHLSVGKLEPMGSISPLSPPLSHNSVFRRPSFNLQLANLNENEYDAASQTPNSASSTIDHRMRRSSIGKSLTKIFGLADLEMLIDEDEKEKEKYGPGIKELEEYIVDPVFASQFPPEEMRCLALVAHNHMKPAMKTFVLTNKNLLCKFKLTGTNTTMTMLKEVFGDNPAVKYGPTCTSGPLGGDAELVAIMCTENLGGCIFFQDPMSSHPHAADIECLTRQGNVHNILMMPNPATAYACMISMRIALKEGRAEIIPSFFKTLSSPSVAEYKIRQARVVERNRTK